MTTSLLERSWPYLLTRGLIAVVFGVVAMAAPLSTVTALAVLWGFWALFDGAGSFAQAFKSTAPLTRRTLAATGLLSVVVAFLAIFSPSLTAVTLTWILGVWLTARGVLECVLALGGGAQSGRLALLANALLDILLGTLFMTNPGRASVGIAFVLGLSALAWGVVLLVLAWWVRRSGAPPGG